MDELTVDQAWTNVTTAVSTFQGNQQQWAVLNASIAKVHEAIHAGRAATNGQVDSPLTARS